MAVKIMSGSRWWKFDFHTHTPASDDFKATPEVDEKEWLLGYMKAGVDCVAVTDHNAGEWIDGLKQALDQLARERPEGYRDITLFPGVEISVTGGVHLLAIFDPAKTTDDIVSLLGETGFPSGKHGSCQAETEKSFVEVVKIIANKGGIPIPAHVDGNKGLFQAFQGISLQEALQCPEVYAMELKNPDFQKPGAYLEHNRKWTEVLGSDGHDHPPSGSRFTWVKMGQSPTLDGIRLALMDKDFLSTVRADSHEGDPNDEHAPETLESIEVGQACYMGRSQPFSVSFSPWLTAIIGGRGTGKSTLVEFLRLALRRDNELPQEFRSEHAMYTSDRAQHQDGLMTEDTTITVTYRKDASRYRIHWDASGSAQAIEKEIGENQWQNSEGSIKQRFPVRIYSQKQVYQMARNPGAMLDIIDDTPEIEKSQWVETWKSEENRYLTICAKIHETEDQLKSGPRLRGSLEDVRKKLELFESKGHARILKELQRRKRQQRSMEDWEESWEDAWMAFEEAIMNLEPAEMDTSSYDMAVEEDRDLCATVAKVQQELVECREQVEKIVTKVLRDIKSDWKTGKDRSSWKAKAENAADEYRDLCLSLREMGTEDPSDYGVLVQQHQSLENQLHALDESREQVERFKGKARDHMKQLLRQRQELTRSRMNFLKGVLDGNRHVQIRVIPYGSLMAQDEFRGIIGLEGKRFKNDIDSLLGFLGETEPRDTEQKEKNIHEVKVKIREIHANESEVPVQDRRFVEHIRKLSRETLDRLDTWFPGDSLEVKYSPRGDGKGFRMIESGSPGQKTAALLAFLLSYGTEPLVLDQPEDDLDNRLIYDLIVAQLRENKQRRQVLVVTHNANVVVNGDAELIVGLEARHGETQTLCRSGLQEEEARKTVCDIMEGGTRAFQKRYRRIAVGKHHV